MHDIDFEYKRVTVRSGKGGKDRVTTFPKVMEPLLRTHLDWVKPIPGNGKKRRHHVDPSMVNKAIKSAVRKTGLHKKVSAHTFRHGFATHLLQRGTDIRTIQALHGHNQLSTTMLYYIHMSYSRVGMVLWKKPTG